MDHVELLEGVRQAYIDRLAVALHTARTTHGERAVTEAALRDAGGVPLGSGALNLPSRVDALVRHEGQAPETLTVEADGPAGEFTYFAVEWSGGLAVVLGPFRWDRLRVHLPDGSAAMEWEPLLTWYDDWFRADEDGTGDLLLAVHSLGDPADTEDGVELFLDLGSAPVEALNDLLDAIAGLDVSRAILGEPVEPEEPDGSASPEA